MLNTHPTLWRDRCEANDGTHERVLLVYGVWQVSWEAHTRSGKGCFSTYPRLLTLPSFMAPRLTKTQFSVLWSRARTPISVKWKLTDAR
jgi:hypothetical protein